MRKSRSYYLVKFLDIVYVSNLYVFFGVIASGLINKLIIPYDEERVTILNLLYLIFIISLLALAVILIRNLIKFWIPSPFDGIAGFKHHFLRELNGNVLLAFSFLIFLRDSLREYIYNLYKLI